jgi:hypothetical protein
MNGPVIKTAIGKYLSLPHRKTCSYWVYSGDRHCSCGLERAREELRALKAEQQIQMFVELPQAVTTAERTDA